MALNERLRARLDELRERHREIGERLSDPAVIADQDLFRELSQEYAQLSSVCDGYNAWEAAMEELAELDEMASDGDPEIQSMAADDRPRVAAQLEQVESGLLTSLTPTDPNDQRNIFLEIRAGTGGDEAALFAGDLFRMYSRYAEQRRWKVEVLSSSEGDHGGFKEIISRIEGSAAYSRLKFESGAHRVQRVPKTESQGRIHTSACTVAVLPEPEDVEDVALDSSELRIDTFRASGAGGQHINKTDSAIRITHLPSGIVVECQDERSQHKNRARAMALLKARLRDDELRRQEKEQADTRRQLVGSGDRSERIRTYNFAEGRVSDHRINLTLYKLQAILDEGDLDPLIDPLTAEHNAEMLAAFSD